MSEEKRVDPADGFAYTLGELTSFYTSFRKKAVKAYWNDECTPVRAAKPKAKAAAKVGAEGRRGVRSKFEALARVMSQREKDWRIGPVVYQVFVDRFVPPADLESRRALFPPPCTLHSWSDAPARGSLVEEVGYWQHELQFWGGDLPGVTSKLDYLKELGADVLYLQPVCEAYSNHKYDATDYKKVEPQYGTEEDFRSLAGGVHARDMKLVLDGVFNHICARSPIFKEALDNEESSNREWFFFGSEYPKGFKTWGGSENLTELRLENKALQEYIWRGQDSVVGTWLDRGADGWRLDVASEIGFGILKEITDAAHRRKPGSLVVGEVWCYPQRWTSSMDGVLSLHLGTVVLGLAEGTCPGPTAARSIAGLVADSSIEEVLRSWIVFSNHDMPRLATRLPDLKRRQFAQTLQFALPGAPLVYYGDEIGMAGGDDPDNRGTFQWDQATDENEMLAHTRRLTAMRRKHRGLRIGNYRALESPRLMAFLRWTERVRDIVIVLANPTQEPVKEMVIVPVPAILGHTLFRDELTGEEVRLHGSTVTMEVQPSTARILVMQKEDNPAGFQYKRMYGHWHTLSTITP